MIVGLATTNNSRGKKDAGEILEHLVSDDCPVTLLKTTTTQCNHCGAFANQTVHTSVEEYDSTKWLAHRLHVSFNLWRQTRHWLRLVVVQKGLTGDEASAAVRFVEAVIHANTMAYEAKLEAQSQQTNPAAPPRPQHPPGYHAPHAKPPLDANFVGGMLHLAHALGLPGAQPHAGPPPAPPPVQFPYRDLVGELEAVAVRQGWHEPNNIIHPPAEQPQPREGTPFMRLPAYTRRALTELVHRVFAVPGAQHLGLMMGFSGERT